MKDFIAKTIEIFRRKRKEQGLIVEVVSIVAFICHCIIIGIPCAIVSEILGLLADMLFYVSDRVPFLSYLAKNVFNMNVGLGIIGNIPTLLILSPEKLSIRDAYEILEGRVFCD